MVIICKINITTCHTVTYYADQYNKKRIVQLLQKHGGEII